MSPERALIESNIVPFAGADEVGRGALAGPIVACAVVLTDPKKYSKIRVAADSKSISPKKRAELFKFLRSAPYLRYSISLLFPHDIDRLGIQEANKEVLRMCIASLCPRPKRTLVDWLNVSVAGIEVQAFAKGDSICRTISAASIMAKVTRDRVMAKLDDLHPEYGFKSNKGYGTPFHLEAIAKHGPCELHRRTFSPVSRLKFDL